MHIARRDKQSTCSTDLKCIFTAGWQSWSILRAVSAQLAPASDEHWSSTPTQRERAADLQALAHNMATGVPGQARLSSAIPADQSQGLARMFCRAVPHMYAFVLKFGGGAEGRELRETEEFVKQLSRPASSSGPWGQMLGTACACPGKQLLRLRHAALRLSYHVVDSASLSWIPA